MKFGIQILPLLAATVLTAVAQARETKFIAHGWDCQSAHPEDVLASAAEFDKTPLDGISLSVRFTNEAAGVVCSYKTMISDPAWTWRDLEGYVPTLREIVKHRSLRESLLSAFRCPKKRLDWRDDAAWANFANNIRLLARLAREGNVRGLMIDPEDYPRSKQFYLQSGDLAYDETVALARRRGREVFSAVFEEKPDAVILAFWLLATDKNIYNSHDPQAAMRECGCLFPAFMDGLMDVLPPTALLVDGNEGTYRCEAPYRDHYVDACQQRRNALDLLSPENRDKYRVQHRVGCGFFLDGYWYDSSNKWYFEPFNGTRTDRFGLNLADAAQAADYVWLDGEWRTYVNWTKAQTKGHHLGDHFLERETWAEIMPGFWNEIRAAKDPCGAPYGKRTPLHVEKAQTVKGSRSFRVENVKYGEIYEVVGKPLTDLAFLRVDWKKEKGEKWAGRANSVQVVGGRAVFRVPQGVDTFAVIYSAARCKDGTASFSEVVANRLEVLSDDERTLTVAADELHKYWLQITGDQRVIPVRLAIDPTVSKSGNDAYAIKTVDGVARITGSNARSVLYGVYDLLERRGGCGWFWDGDRVPKLKKIDVSGLDVREESRFEYRGLRYFAHRGLTRFQAEHWGFDDWKREIDWCLKNRLNLFMLRIGQDDIFQKAYPDACAYPDASKPLPGQHNIYNNRSLFWPLEFRGELRQKVMDYAFARGMMAPEDFGTMTHWYSRTPQDFLDKMNPEFLPQASGAYGEPSGLVWDIRKKKWMDAYWKLTDAAIANYGRPDILHTIGVAERKMSDDPQENRKRKIDWTNMLLDGARTRYPGCRRILAGWDLYCMKEAAEVKAFLRHIPEDVVIWDYEADAYDRTNFTEWDLVGKRPYTFGVFTAYEAGLDMRTDYDLLAARQKLIADDPMCKGYIFWPESSHTDSLGIEWFARNAWRADRPEVRPIVKDYCRRRYSNEAAEMERLWLETLPISTNMQSRWNKNALLTVLREFGEGLVKPERRADWPAAKPDACFAALKDVVGTLKRLDWDKDELLRRDMVDIARVWADRLAVESENRMVLAYLRWLDGDEAAKADVVREGAVARARLQALSDILSTHTDFSICDTYDRLCAVHPVTLPTFASVLVDNAANYYCASHQAELAVHCYIPAFDAYLDLLKSRMMKNDRTPPERFCLEDHRKRAMRMSFEELRGNPDRSRAAFNRALDELARAAGPGARELVGRDRLFLKDKDGALWWKDRHEAKLKEIADGPKDYDLVMIGDSITDYWETRPSNGWETVTNTWKTLNLGFRGDRVQNVIWRLEHGEMDGFKAKTVTLMIGTNNHAWRLEPSDPNDTARAVERIIHLIRVRQPEARIVLFGIFPRGTSAKDAVLVEGQRRNVEANGLLRRVATETAVEWVDLMERYLDPETGFCRPELFRDGTHPSRAGYEIWRAALDRVMAPREMTPPPALVTTGDWDARRAEMLKTLAEGEYGVRPVERPANLRFSPICKDRDALGGKAIRRRVRISYGGPGGKGHFDVLALLPKGREKAPAFVQIMLGQYAEKIGFNPNKFEGSSRCPLEKIIDAGYALVTFVNWEVAMDDPATCFQTGVFTCWPPTDGVRGPKEWGAISAWAWGASRVMDWIETVPELDASRVAVIGHSRGGKTALWAGATDPRFAYVISNNSGCSGARISHLDLPGAETVARITTRFPHWFCVDYRQWGNRQHELPFDQHWLLALIAPRLLSVASATLDTWAGPTGEFESARLASPAWERFGMKGLVADAFPPPEAPRSDGSVSYHLRTGKHDLTEEDWAVYLDFVARQDWQKSKSI